MSAVLFAATLLLGIVASAAAESWTRESLFTQPDDDGS